MSEPTYVFTETNQNGAVYETYRAADAAAAKAFLLTRKVERELHYVVVETPEGNWGTDIDGLYLENLLPWQSDTRTADCAGQILAVQSTSGATTAARGIVDNFVVRVGCGRCGHAWFDGVRYQNDTLVRCPACAARNSVDSSGVIVSQQPDRQATVVLSSHPILNEPNADAGIPDAAVGEEAMLAGVDQAIVAARAAVAASQPGQPHRPGRLFHLGSALEERFLRTGELTDLDAAITAFAESAGSTPPQDPGLLERLTAVGRARYVRFERAAQQVDLAAAIAALRAALAAASPAAHERTELLYRLALALRDRFEHTGQLSDLDDAATAVREAAARTSPDELRHANCLTALSVTLRIRFEHAGQRADLEEAIAAGRAAMAGAGPGHPGRLASWSALGLALQERFTATGNVADLDEAVTVFTNSLDAASPDDPNYPGLQHNLGRAQLARFNQVGRSTDLEASVAAARAAATAINADDPSYAKHLVQFGNALITRYTRTGDLADLDEGVAAQREAVVATPPDHADYPLHAAGLGAALLTRYQRRGDLGELDEAIDILREVVRITPATHADLPRYLDTLSAALQNRYEHTRQLADLDEAVTAGRTGIAGTATEHAYYPMRLSNFGAALHARFRHTSSVADLDESIAADRDATAAMAPDHPDRPAALSNLATALIDRFDRTDDRADLDAAVDARREAVATNPAGHPLHSTYLHGLSYVLRVRYRTGAQPADLDEAIVTGRAAVRETPADHPDLANRLVNLAVLLEHRFRRTRDPADLDDAIAAADAATARIPAEDPTRLHALSVYGALLWTRCRHTGQRTGLDRALAAFDEAVRIEAGPPRDRINVARLWGDIAMEAGMVDAAADGLAAAVRLLPQFAWHGLPRATREERITEWRGLAADAAACAVRAGRPERAVELLEAGRSVLWSQLFNLRTDLTDLAEWEPDLADRLDRIRTQLAAPLPEMPAASPVTDIGPVDWSGTEQNRVAEQRMRLAREFDELVGRIRTVSGFEHFLEPTSFARLRAAASGGPVAVVNASRYGCHALLISGPGVQVVELTGLTHEKVVGQSNILLGILAGAGSPNRPFLDRERDRHTVLDILAWLWDTVARPVLAELGHTGPPAPGEALPRIWWCPTGRLALLPLHAAGHHPYHQVSAADGTDTVLDRVISSYTPTLTALLRARSAPELTGTPALLAVGMPTTPGAADLPAVPDELDRVHARFPITTRLQSAEQATTSRVLHELPRHAWAHFSCHGSQHFSDPTASAFLLADGPLHITDLIENSPGPRELAFLSACQTATGGLRAVDEAIHLAAAMQLLGYRNVIATLWSIYDSLAPDVADTVYTSLAATDPPDAAHAVHRAVTAVRAQRPTDPLAWAPYLHTGP